MPDAKTTRLRMSELPEARIRRTSRFSVVWLVPLLAAAICAVLVYESWLDQGPRITIMVEDGYGLTPGQTPVRYQGVECGLVESISLSPDLAHVLVEVRLRQMAADFARQGARFWVMRPEVSVVGVRGLEALMSGPYIQAVPGSGEPQGEFVALADPPPPETLEPGLEVVLLSDQRGSLRVGSPVYFRQVEVGKVKQYDLSADAQSVEIKLHIDRDHAPLVRTTTKFWNVSGLDMTIGLSGAELDLESLESLLAGGVAFDTPPGSGAPVEAGSVFRLYGEPPDEHDDSAEEAAPPIVESGLRLTLTADGLGGLDGGSPVYFRQVKIGRVESYRLGADATRVEIIVVIKPEHSALMRTTTEFWNVSGIDVEASLSGVKIGVESLQPLLVGGIAAYTPPLSGDPVKDGAVFPLLAKPPKEPAGEAVQPAGIGFTLVAQRLRGLSGGAPIYYRQVRVGNIERYDLGNNARWVHIEARIDERYRPLLRRNSKFWNASGVGVDVGLGGASIDIESLQAAIGGGVAFATPDEPGEVAEDGAIFYLHEAADEGWIDWAPAIEIESQSAPRNASGLSTAPK